MAKKIRRMRRSTQAVFLHLVQMLIWIGIWFLFWWRQLFNLAELELIQLFRIFYRRVHRSPILGRPATKPIYERWRRQSISEGLLFISWLKMNYREWKEKFCNMRSWYGYLTEKDIWTFWEVICLCRKFSFLVPYLWPPGNLYWRF